jgi:hypothetical protein
MMPHISLYDSNWNPSVEVILLMSTEEKNLQTIPRRTRKAIESQIAGRTKAILPSLSIYSAGKTRKRVAQQTSRSSKKRKESIERSCTIDESETAIRVDYEGRSMCTSPASLLVVKKKPEDGTFLLPKGSIFNQSPYSDCANLAEVFDTCMRALQPGYNTGVPAVMPDSQFEHNLRLVYSFLLSSIQSSGQHGTGPNDPSAIYVCGLPGIGKTAGVYWCCEKAIEECKNKGFGHSVLCKINSTILITASASDASDELFTEMGRVLGISSTPTRACVERRMKRGKKGKHTVMILVIDEMDMLLSDSSNGRKSKRPEHLLHEIMQMANDINYRLVLIGISNSSGEVKCKRMQQGGKVCDT